MPRPVCIALFVASVAVSALASSASAQTEAEDVAKANAAGWQVPAGALTERSPLAASPEAIKKGSELYAKHCRQCHGSGGRGDGPYADKAHPPADLTASALPDGIAFYKIWNGRKSPAMPAFKSMLAKDEVWSIVEHIRSLRPPTAP